MLHSLHHSPPFKRKRTNIILIPKLLHKLTNNLIITSRLPPRNHSVNNKMTKQKRVFKAMSVIEINLST
jgi:hypothetical protein